MKLTKVMILGALFGFSLLGGPKQVKAQGTCECQPGFMGMGCAYLSENCDPGYVFNCKPALFGYLGCNNNQSCECVPDPTASPTTVPGAPTAAPGAPTTAPGVPTAFPTIDPVNILQLDEHIFCDNYPADGPNPRVYTALGCVPVKAGDFMAWLLPYVFGIAGGIAFLLMAYGFIQISTAKGDPKAMQAAKETISSALTGLLVSVFSLFILRLIAVDILHIPGIN